jgi:hypothetical protein
MKYKNKIKNKKKQLCSARYTLIAKPKELKDLKKWNKVNKKQSARSKMKKRKENIPWISCKEVKGPKEKKIIQKKLNIRNDWQSIKFNRVYMYKFNNEVILPGKLSG